MAAKAFLLINALGWSSREVCSKKQIGVFIPQQYGLCYVAKSLPSPRDIRLHFKRSLLFKLNMLQQPMQSVHNLFGHYFLGKNKTKIEFVPLEEKSDLHSCSPCRHIDTLSVSPTIFIPPFVLPEGQSTLIIHVNVIFPFSPCSTHYTHYSDSQGINQWKQSSAPVLRFLRALQMS